MLALEEKTGVKNPRLLSRPQLRADCAKYLNVFRALSNARQFNQIGILPIPVTEVLAYIQIAEIERGYPAEKLLRIIQALDATHLTWWSKKQK